MMNNLEAIAILEDMKVKIDIPNCNNEFEMFYERCPNCGQRLRWEK